MGRPTHGERRSRVWANLSGDVTRLLAAVVGDGASRGRKLGFFAFNSEFHCVAAYRFGQFARDVNARSSLLGVPLMCAHRVWNRWVTHIDHCEISSMAQIDAGLLIMHRTGVLIGPAKIGKNAVIHQNVTIGQRVAGGDQGVPSIGDNVWIGPGATVTGGITVGDGATISAGAVLSRDVPPRALIGGVPGRVLAMNYDNSSIIGVPVT